MASTTVGSLNVMVGANVERLQKRLRKARKNISAFTSRIGRASKAMAKFGAAGTAAAASGLAYLAVQEGRVIMRTKRVADRLGTTTKALSRLQFAAQATGVENERLQEGLQEMRLRLQEAASTGSGPAAEALDKLGLSAARLARMDPAKAFREISNAVKGSNIQDFAIDSIFGGSDGRELTNLIMRGAEGIRQLGREGRRMGATFSDIDASRVIVAARAMQRLQAVVRAAARTVAIQLAPYVAAAGNKIAKMATNGRGMGQIVTGAIEWVVKSIAKMTDWWNVTRAAFFKARAVMVKGLGLVVRAVQKVGEAVVWLINKIPSMSAKMDKGVKRMADALSQVAKEANQNAAKAFDAFEKGANQQKVAAFFDDIEKKSQKAADSLKTIGTEKPSKMKDFAKGIGKKASQAFNPEKTGQQQGKAAARAQRQGESRDLIRSGSAQAMAFGQKVQKSNKVARKQLRIQNAMAKDTRALSKKLAKNSGGGGEAITIGT
jgi:hypothetical protein